MKFTLVLTLLSGVSSLSSLRRPLPARMLPQMSADLDRRTLLTTLPSAALLTTLAEPVSAAAAKKAPKKVVVLGGAGFVGSHVSELLVKEGYEVLSVSRSSPTDQAAKVKATLGAPLSNVQYVSIDASTGDLGSGFKDAVAVVSCVGIVPGGQNQRAGNGAVNVRIADQAKAAGVPRFVYISVASAISEGPGKFIFPDYVKGKAEAEKAVVADFGTANALIIRPAIISGGPPGPPGPPGVPPVSVDAVAKTAVAGALGRQSGTFDGAKQILAAAAAL